jgi:hypothetical protein
MWPARSGLSSCEAEPCTFEPANPRQPTPSVEKMPRPTMPRTYGPSTMSRYSRAWSETDSP